MRTILFSTLLAFSFLYFGCTKEKSIANIAIEEKIVVNSVNSPQNFWEFYLSNSVTIENNDDPNPLAGAEIKLYDWNDSLIEIVPEVASGFYQSINRPSAMSTYYIVAEVPSIGLVSATTYIPTQVSFSSSYNQESIYFDNSVREVHLTIQENIEEENFYIVNSYVTIFDNSGLTQKRPISIFTSDANSENGDIGQFSESFRAVYIKDNNLPFEAASFNTTVYLALSDITSSIINPAVDSIHAIVNLYSTDEDLFKYAISYEKSLNTEEFIGGFLGIPSSVRVHSNIKDGIGIFGGFTKDSLTIRIH